ncbi:MAG: IS200/IS605 family transposase [Phycisphaerales bacterium]
MPGAWTQLHAHIVFSTKRRAELITSEFEPRLYAFLGGIARERKCQLVSGNGMPDHVHLLVRFPGEVAIADLVKHLKSRSTTWVNEEKLTSKRFSWQEGYGAFTVGLETMPKVKSYIAKQKSHHARMSFVDEVKEMLKRAGMEDRLSDVVGDD